jgi:hypothetical protein
MLTVGVLTGAALLAEHVTSPSIDHWLILA